MIIIFISLRVTWSKFENKRCKLVFGPNNMTVNRFICPQPELDHRCTVTSSRKQNWAVSQTDNCERAHSPEGYINK